MAIELSQHLPLNTLIAIFKGVFHLVTLLNNKKKCFFTQDKNLLLKNRYISYTT